HRSSSKRNSTAPTSAFTSPPTAGWCFSAGGMRSRRECIRSTTSSSNGRSGTRLIDDLMEGLYLRTEATGVVTGRAKLVRSEFVEKIKQSDHWQHRAMVPNELTATADRPEEVLHLWKLAAEENGCFGQPNAFANDHARFHFFRQE